MKKILNKQEALTAIFTGSILTAHEWDKTVYIHMIGGQIVDNENELFNISNTDINEWMPWEEPKALKGVKLSKAEALSAIFAGERVYTDTMNKGVYIFVDNGQVIQSDKKPFNIIATDIDEWFIFEDETQNNNDEVTKVLMNQIEILTKENTNLRESQKTKITDGRDTETQNNTAQMVKDVYGVTEPTEVKNLFKKSLQDCKDKRDVQVAVIQAIPYCWIGGRALNTTAQYYVQMRNIVKEVGGEYEEMALSLLLPPAGLYEATQTKVIETTKEKHADRDTYDKEHMYTIIDSLKKQIDTDDISKTRQQTQERANAYVYATYLALVTGRRQIEIIKTLEIVKNGKDWCYEGISKKGEENISIKAYSLDNDFKRLAELLAYIQNILGTKKMTNQQANSKFNNPFNSAFRKLTNTNFTFHDAREIFADIMYQESEDIDGTWNNELDFKSKILGHSITKERLTATEYYMTKKAQ